ncbi:mucin-binding protein, partial [Loigolactobacillus zhaoyuanensis]
TTVEPTDPQEPGTPIDPTDPEGPKYPEGVSESDLNKTVSRTIAYKGAGNATPQTVTQTAHYMRTAKIDGKTGELLSYGDWVLATSEDGNNTNDGFTAVTSPKVAGFTADKNVPAATLTNDEVSDFKADTANVTVTYTSNGSIEVPDPTDPTKPIDPTNPEGPKFPEITAADLNQTVTRTTAYYVKASNDPNAPAAPQTVTQTTNYKRSGIVDKVTGELLGFTDWAVNGANNLVDIASPELQNYVADPANIAGVTLSNDDINALRAGGQNLDQTVTYTFNGSVTTPENPGGGGENPGNGGNNGNNANNNGNNNNNGAPGADQSGASATVVHTAIKPATKPVVVLAGDATSLKRAGNEHKLPQTNESANAYLGLVGMFIIGLAALAGIEMDRRRRRDGKD